MDNDELIRKIETALKTRVLTIRITPSDFNLPEFGFLYLDIEVLSRIGDRTLVDHVHAVNEGDKGWEIELMPFPIPLLQLPRQNGTTRNRSATLRRQIRRRR